MIAMPDVRAGAAVVGPLGILACAGPLPIEIAEAAQRQGRAVHIVAIDGFAGDDVARFPHDRVHLGQLGRILASLARAGARDLVIAGAMRRPDLLGLRIDLGFVRHIGTILSLTRGGDDHVLSRVVRFFEDQGFRVVGTADVAPALLAPLGLLTDHAPTAAQSRDIGRGARLVAALAAFDVGQAVVADARGIVAVEGVRGTDALLRDLGPGGAGEGSAFGGVLVKRAKPGQELRVDLPTIGPETVRRAKFAGLAGIAIEAGKTIVLERQRVAAEAADAGLFITGFTDADAPGLSSPPDGNAILELAGRLAPTPRDRTDIAIGQKLVRVLREHGAGRACVVASEHVLAVSGRLPVPSVVAALGRPPARGWRAWRSRSGVLVIDGVPRAGPEESFLMLERSLFQAGMQSGLAGIVLLGPLPMDERRDEIIGWANEAGVFLMAGSPGESQMP